MSTDLADAIYRDLAVCVAPKLESEPWGVTLWGARCIAEHLQRTMSTLERSAHVAPALASRGHLRLTTLSDARQRKRRQQR